MALKPPEEKTVVQRYLPIADWLPKYDWGGWLRFDLIAALTVWALLVPEAMAYAGIAGVSAEVGLVTAPLALLGYAIFGSSKHLFVGPSSTVAIISASVVAPLAGSDGDLYLILTIWLAIFTGVFFVGLGLARMGWIANFMSTSVLAGFMVGLAIVIAVGQLDKVLGIEAEGDNVLEDLGSMIEQFSDWDWPTVIIGVVALAALFAIERFLPKVPGALVVMLGAIALSAILDWEDGGIHVVGEIPAELPNLSIPEIPEGDVLGDLLAGALAVVVVAFAESFAAAKTYASKFGYQVDANQEMIGLGAANLGAGLSGGFVVDGSLSKTAAGVGAGQKSQMTSVFAAVFVLITIVALTWLFEPLPEAVLGAIVIHAVWGLIDFSKFTRLWRIRHRGRALAVGADLPVEFPAGQRARQGRDRRRHPRIRRRRRQPRRRDVDRARRLSSDRFADLLQRRCVLTAGARAALEANRSAGRSPHHRLRTDRRPRRQRRRGDRLAVRRAPGRRRRDVAHPAPRRCHGHRGESRGHRRTRRGPCAADGAGRRGGVPDPVSRTRSADRGRRMTAPGTTASAPTVPGPTMG
jgi:hypothetical protein